MSIRFIKMHGLGNDFIIIDDLGKPEMLMTRLDPALIRRLCDRRLGIGADQLLWLKSARSQAADLRMEILNADGSEAEMCGNGIRAVGLYLVKNALDRIPGRGAGPNEWGDPPDIQQDEDSSTFQIETLAGIKPIEVFGEEVRVNMGVPKISPVQEVEVDGRRFQYYPVDVGNPHAVIFVDTLEGLAVEHFGPLIEVHPHFVNRTNVEFVQVLTSSAIQVRVWERGAGLTLACGTGACAAAVAALHTGKVRGSLSVLLPGGELKISWQGEGRPVHMEGPAVEVFRGEFFV